MKTTNTYDHYYKYEELTNLLQGYAADYPDYCRLESIGETLEKRQMWLLSITKLADGDFADKPACGVNANIHAGEVTGTMCCMYFIDYLLTNREDPEVDWLLSHFTVYCVPRITPDGAEYYLTTPYSLRSVNRYYPYEQEQPGVQPEDMDGDGVIRQMRVENPNGGFKISERDPRIMVRRRPDDIEGTFYDVYPEGIIKDYDGGEISRAPERFGNDFNRNFPMNWLPENRQKGAGAYALSNPETRALADYMYSRKNLCAVLNFHTSGGIYLYPPGFKSAKDADKADIARVKALGEMATEETGYPALNLLDEYVGKAAGSMGIVGAFDDFVSYTLGIIDFTCECWDLENRAGHPSIWPRPAHTPDAEREQTLSDCIKWLEDNNHGEGFKDWTTVLHPQLGTVEIGGMDEKYTRQNPPSAFLLQEVEKHTRFLLRYMKTLPRLAFQNTAVESLAEGMWKIDTTVINLGYLPTCAMTEAQTLHIVKPLNVSLDGANPIVGKKSEEIGQLEGFSSANLGSRPGAGTMNHAPYSKKLSWTVKAKPGTEITITCGAPRAGIAKETVVLRV